MSKLSIGQPAPQFQLTDQDGKSVSLSDYAGSPVVVYFYPAAMTPGCTKQACDFRDSLSVLQQHGYAVLGISPDPVAKLLKFHERDSLTFPLLSDQDHTVAEAYGAWGEKKNYGKVYEGLIRSTVVVDAEGKVQLAQYNVRATGYVARLLKALEIV